NNVVYTFSLSRPRPPPRSPLFPYTTLFRSALVIPQLGNGTTKERVKRAPEKSLGWAIDKVKAPEPIASLVAQLLHDVAIFQNLRSEEHTSELQSRFDLVCRLLLEKKKKYKK